MKLISMTDYVLNKHTSTRLVKGYDNKFISEVVKYANFLKTPLNLGMFVPVDEDGYVFEEPENYNLFYNGTIPCTHAEQYNILGCLEYQEAEKRVLFEGFEYTEGGVHSEYEIIRTKDLKGKTIEDLVNMKYNLTLTQNAINKFNI